MGVVHGFSRAKFTGGGLSLQLPQSTKLLSPSSKVIPVWKIIPSNFLVRYTDGPVTRPIFGRISYAFRLFVSQSGKFLRLFYGFAGNLPWREKAKNLKPLSAYYKLAEHLFIQDLRHKSEEKSLKKMERAGGKITLIAKTFLLKLKSAKLVCLAPRNL